MIPTICHKHYGRYECRRIAIELQNKDVKINNKALLRLMNDLELKSLIRVKKY